MKQQKTVILICIIAVLISAILSLDCGDLIRRVQTGSTGYVILIDPGHGGMDGGAGSSDGTLEKDINLEIAKRLADEAELYDCRAVLTRETDEWLCETEEGSIRSRKTADLMARRDMIRKYEPDVTVSIHLNSFREDPSVRGAQVFYPAGGEPVSETSGHENETGDVMQECRILAETVQSKMNETLQAETPRTAMTRDGVFIFKEVERPVIIIECGFISNPDEAEKLKTGTYQEELARCIMEGIAEFADLKKTETVEIIDSLRKKNKCWCIKEQGCG